MKIIVFGTGPFCVPSLNWLADSPHSIAAIVTRPIDDAGKRRKSVANPVREYAIEKSYTIHEPKSCNEDEFVGILNDYGADLFFVCDYGQILSKACLATAKLGGINLHGSLLPKYRGAAPINWAIYHGEAETGVTVIHMTAKLDGGPCLTTAKIPIKDHDTAETIETALSKIGVDAVERAIDMLNDWDSTSSIGNLQKQSRATKAPRLNKSDGKIDWTRTAKQLVDQIRAFKPWPNSFCEWQHGKQPIRLIVHQAQTMQIETNAPAGVIVAVDKKLLAVQTAEHALAIEIIQPAGKKAMPVADFLRGHKLQVGQTMG